MNDAAGTKAIDLAGTADFTLGSVAVHPSTREIANGSARELVEPRVMQVLVALAQRQGQVVSRDSLVEMCWGGRAVGEDAIQRCIAKLRKLAETSGAFAIDTVARVGYRLRVDGQAPAVEAVAASEPVLVVLPFDNLSDDREMQFFSDGVSEEILQAIAQARGVTVIGRISAFQFRGERKALAAQTLKATHVLDGSVRRSGSRIRISAQLTHAEKGTSLWSDQFDRDIGDSLALQTEIATAIAQALRLRLDKSAPTMQFDPIAYDLWLRARAIKAKDLTDQSSAAAVALLEQAVARAPGFARGWSSLAMNRMSLLPRTHDATGTPAHQAALDAAKRALSIDPNAGEAVQTLAFLQPAFSNYAAKLELFKRSAMLEPNDATVAFGYACALVSLGRVSDAWPFFRRALELEPLSAGVIGVSALGLAGLDLSAARRLVQDGLDRIPDSQLLWFADIMLQDGSARILAQLDKYGSMHPNAALPEMQIIRYFHSSFLLPVPERRQAVKNIFGPNDSFLRLGLCGYAVDCGCADEVFAALEDAFQSGQQIAAPGAIGVGIPRALQSSALFYFNTAALRRDQRFAMLCARLGLVDYWTTSGHWPDCADEVPYDFKAECVKAVAELTKA